MLDAELRVNGCHIGTVHIHRQQDPRRWSESGENSNVPVTYKVSYAGHDEQDQPVTYGRELFQLDETPDQALATLRAALAALPPEPSQYAPQDEVLRLLALFAVGRGGSEEQAAARDVLAEHGIHEVWRFIEEEIHAEVFPVEVNDDE
jgi:hypothetical protein